MGGGAVAVDFLLSVLPFTELSDHCCISTFIKINRVLERGGTVEERVGVNPNPLKHKFDKDRIHIFQTNVQLSEKLEPLKTLINTNPNSTSLI